MRTLNFAVDSPLRAEDVGYPRIHWRLEFPRPFWFRTYLVEYLLLQAGILADFLKLFRAGLGVLLGNFDGNVRILCRTNSHFPLESKFFAAGGGCFQF